MVMLDGLIAFHGQSGDIMFQGATEETTQTIFNALNDYGFDMGGADAERFTLKKGNKLTFKATAFKAQSNTYRVKIKVFQERL
jgi:hypothetical protein